MTGEGGACRGDVLTHEGTVDLREQGVSEAEAAELRPAGVLRRKIGIDRKWMFTMTSKRGDVVLALFPDSNLPIA